MAHAIIQQEIVFEFKMGNYNKGVSTGISATMQAAKGKYKLSIHKLSRAETVAIVFFMWAVLLFVFIEKIWDFIRSINSGRWGGRLFWPWSIFWQQRQF
jgi:uncharacterized membrane protein YgcG